MGIKDKIIVYIYNKGNQLEYEREALKHQRRYETMDAFDIYENMRADIRNEAWNEFVNELFRIIMYCDTGDNKANYTKRKKQ